MIHNPYKFDIISVCNVVKEQCKDEEKTLHFKLTEMIVDTFIKIGVVLSEIEISQQLKRIFLNKLERDSLAIIKGL